MTVDRDAPDLDGRLLTEVEKIVQSAIDQRKAGLDVNYVAIEQEHAELMPELGNRLRRLRAIEAAAAQARRQSHSNSLTGEADTVCEDDLNFLGNALDGYEILERIEYGGQGVVYRGVQRTTKRAVAIKVLLDGPLAPQRQRARFAREVELVSRLRHPNIVAVYESGLVRRRQYLAMEYVDGLPIDDYALLNALPVREIVRLFRIVCQAVSEAHQHGIIHRDLKPANILVDAEGNPHVLDFGLAKQLAGLGAGESASALSVTGQVLGTLPYVSPEQVSGVEDEVDVRSDIYSLGIVLFEAVTGGFPYPVDGSRQAVRANILAREPIKMRLALSPERGTGFIDSGDVSEDLERIVLKALDKDKSRRYQSAAAFSDDLGRYLEGDAVEARGANRLYLLRKTLRRFRAQVAVSVVIVMLVVGSSIGMGILWQRAERIARIAQAGLEVGGFVKLGSAARDAGRFDQAIAMFQKAIEISEHVSSRDPYVQRHLYDAHHRLAEMFIDAASPGEADAHCQTATAIAEALVRRHPEDVEWYRQLGFAYKLRGRLAFAREEWENALADFDRAASIRGDVLALEPENASLRSELARIHNTRGECHLVLKRFDEALQHYTRAHELLQQLVESEPNTVDHAIQLTRTEAKIGVWHLCQRTSHHNHAALDWLSRAEDRLHRLRNSTEGPTREWDIATLLDQIQTNKELALRRINRQSQAPTTG